MQATHALALIGRRITVVARASPPPVRSAGLSAGLGIDSPSSQDLFVRIEASLTCRSLRLGAVKPGSI
jgi:hypothetical protein